MRKRIAIKKELVCSGKFETADRKAIVEWIKPKGKNHPAPALTTSNQNPYPLSKESIPFLQGQYGS